MIWTTILYMMSSSSLLWLYELYGAKTVIVSQIGIFFLIVYRFKFILYIEWLKCWQITYYLKVFFWYNAFHKETSLISLNWTNPSPFPWSRHAINSNWRSRKSKTKNYILEKIEEKWKRKGKNRRVNSKKCYTAWSSGLTPVVLQFLNEN